MNLIMTSVVYPEMPSTPAARLAECTTRMDAMRANLAETRYYVAGTGPTGTIFRVQWTALNGPNTHTCLHVEVTVVRTRGFYRARFRTESGTILSTREATPTAVREFICAYWMGEI